MRHRHRRLRLRDGYPRHAPPGLRCRLRKHTRTVGRVAMDMLFADLGPVPEAAAGSPVTLWGAGLSADEVAGEARVPVSYELLCALSPRVAGDRERMMAKAKSATPVPSAAAIARKWQGSARIAAAWNPS